MVDKQTDNIMAFRKGNSLGGRTKGSPNKATAKVREAFTQLVEDNLDKLQDDLDSLDSKDRLKAIMDLASYVLPKLSAIEQKLEVEGITHELPLFPSAEELAKYKAMDVNNQIKIVDNGS